MANLGFFQLLRKNKELIPLIGFVGVAALGALTASLYASLYALSTKSDVIVNKSGNPEPWENVNPNQAQK
ncbi:chromosome 15 orf 48, partial [Chelydra serpentina]